MMKGKMLIVSAPSGSGKSTIVNWLMQEHPELKLYFSISCTSRAPRGTEQNGVEYFFLTPEEFKNKINNGEFLEYEEVYQDRFYGTLKGQVEKQLEAGQNVVFDVDVKGGISIKNFYGERALSIFIQPPSVEELRRRLMGRGTDSLDAIENRLAKAEYEMTFSSKFDKIVINDNLDVAKAETLLLVSLNRSFDQAKAKGVYRRLDIYESTRKYWAIGKNMPKEIKYVLGVYRGIVRSVIEVESWKWSLVSEDGTIFKRERCMFEGRLIEDSQYLNKDVSDYPFGSGGAIRYIIG